MPPPDRTTDQTVAGSDPASDRDDGRPDRKPVDPRPPAGATTDDDAPARDTGTPEVLSGMLGGVAAGALAGTAIGGPVGTVIGGAIGAAAGAAAGEGLHGARASADDESVEEQGEGVESTDDADEVGDDADEAGDEDEEDDPGVGRSDDESDEPEGAAR